MFNLLLLILAIFITCVCTPKKRGTAPKINPPDKYPLGSKNSLNAQRYWVFFIITLRRGAIFFLALNLLFNSVLPSVNALMYQLIDISRVFLSIFIILLFTSQNSSMYPLVDKLASSSRFKNYGQASAFVVLVYRVAIALFFVLNIYSGVFYKNLIN